MLTYLRNLSKKGQHAFEYAVVLTLVSAGIIIGGRYAARSWNAGMKGFEDSALYSHDDQLPKANLIRDLP